jgi:signal transduction histidine kinase/ligand-binding sensor domain-containing protein
MFSYTQDIFVENFNREEYKAHFQNWSILQAKDGRIYSGNHVGLLVYNGKDWQKIDIPNHTIRSVYEQGEDKIFIGGLNTFGFLEPDKIGRLHFTNLSEKLDSASLNFGDVWNVRGSNNGVYFNTSKSIFKWHNNKLTDLNTGPVLYCFVVNDILFFQSRKDYKLYKEENNNFRAISKKEFENKYVMGMLPFKEKILIATYQNAFYLIDGHSVQSYQSNIDGFVKTNKISTIVKHTNDEIIIATRKNGVVKYNLTSHESTIVNEHLSLQNNNVKAIAKERESTVWLALNNGISRLDFKIPFQKIKMTSTVNILLENQNQLYIGNFEGLSIYNKQTFRNKKIEAVQSVVWDLDHFNESLLIATEDGIYEKSRDTIKKISSGFTSFVHVSKMLVNTLLYHTESGIYSKEYRGSSWRERKLLVNFHGKINSIVENREGVLWLGTTDKGLYKIDYRDFANIEVEHIPFFETKEAWVYSFEDEIFATSSDFGLYRFDPKTEHFIPETRFGKQFSDGSRSVLHLTKDADGNFTFVSHQHIYQALLQKDGSYKLNSRIFNALPQVQTTAIYADSNKVTWIANEKGLYKYDANIEKDIDLAYPVHISKISLNQDSILFGGFHPIDKDSLTFSIDYAQNQLRFEYAAAYYEMPEKTTYSYKLDGYDKTWSAYSTEHFKDYTGLYEGDYTFRVRAKNVYETVSTPESYSFTILAPWYRTWWAYSIYGLCFLLSSFGVVLWFSNKKLKRLNELRRIETAEAKARETELKSQVEKEQMRARISEDLHDEVGSNLSYIKLMSEVLGDQDSAVKNELFKITETASESAQAMRDIVWFVSPENDNLEKYIKKLSEVVHKFMEPYTLNFKAEILSEAENLDINMKRNIFLILKEALQNITKHSQASSVDVHILKDDHRFELRIADNGKGFDLTKDADGNGLKNYKKRAQKIGANFELHSEPNKGTELCLSLTLKA